MKTLSLALAAGTLTAALAGALSDSSAIAAPYKHVLLISVDGLHALDLANYVAANPTSSFAALARTGIFYPNALASAPSDSFPGLVAQVTGDAGSLSPCSVTPRSGPPGTGFSA
jgi:type I phosphodiesterase/nucleotide pyrophosphatase